MSPLTKSTSVLPRRCWRNAARGSPDRRSARGRRTAFERLHRVDDLRQRRAAGAEGQRLAGDCVVGPHAERDAGDARGLAQPLLDRQELVERRVAGALDDVSMRLPVRIVPAVSWPLAFDSRSMPSMTSSLDLCGRAARADRPPPTAREGQVEAGLGVRAAHRPGLGGDAVRVVDGHETQRRRLARRLRDRVLEAAGTASRRSPRPRRAGTNGGWRRSRRASSAHGAGSARRRHRSSRRPPASR